MVLLYPVRETISIVTSPKTSKVWWVSTTFHLVGVWIEMSSSYRLGLISFGTVRDVEKKIAVGGERTSFSFFIHQPLQPTETDTIGKVYMVLIIKFFSYRIKMIFIKCIYYAQCYFILFFNIKKKVIFQRMLKNLIFFYF